MTSVIGADAHYYGSSTFTLQATLACPEVLKRGASKSQPADVTKGMTDMKQNLRDLTLVPKAAEASPPPSPFHDAPLELRGWLKGLDDCLPGEVYEKVLDSESQSWMEENFENVSEAVCGHWEFLKDKVIVTIPCVTHDSTLDTIAAALHANWHATIGLRILAGTHIPLSEGHWKGPDILIFDRGLNWEDPKNLPINYNWPVVVFEVAYSELKPRVNKDILRLMFGMHGRALMGIAIKLKYDDERLISIEIFVYYFSGEGDFFPEEAEPFSASEIYVNQDRKCSKEDLVIPPDFLKHVPDGMKMVISADSLWSDLKKGYQMTGYFNSVFEHFKKDDMPGDELKITCKRQGLHDGDVHGSDESEEQVKKKGKHH
ncbi:uncharacterized protein EV420DRAFT_1480948 [Desarmillaria tabescens]|uniref:Uncharacterized protein n=1 Tax=Armillaria tabescens TaxID=1929756 RepID=A0AA39KC21_ARMTA|nr:uncharacterized protein EV420DRAFT_1480948 [Desarmillaria tabescens]KAK0457074.1 hypothetical protein EV420DRAFT_1480948 [Desarmillaria tabescens]